MTTATTQTTKTNDFTTTNTTITSCKSLWDIAYPIIIKQTEKHSFLTSMVYGTLAENNFRYYVQQDVLYLNDFSYCLRSLSKKALLLCAASCGTSSADSHHNTEASKRLIELADGAEKVEIELHNSYLKQWKNTGSSSSSSSSSSNDDNDDDNDESSQSQSQNQVQSQEQQQMPNTLLYTSYMRRIIDGIDTTYGEGLAVLLPCFWVYMHVGKCMLKLRNEIDNNNITNNENENNNESRSTSTSSMNRPKHYNDWIDMYAGDEFENEVNDYIQLVDNELQRIQTQTLTQQSQAQAQNGTQSVVVKDDDDDDDDDNEKVEKVKKVMNNELKQIEYHFIMSCKLEHMFWDQAITMMDWPTTTTTT